VTGTVLAAVAASALDEARIVEVSCDGLRVSQQGLPGGTVFEVGVIDAPSGAKLAEADVTSTAAGTIDVRIAARLRDVRQIVVEVERRSDGAEYGEVGADLPQPCSTASAAPSPLLPSPSSSPSSAAAPSCEPTPAAGKKDDGTDTSRVPVVLIAAAGLLVAAGALAVRRRRA
jgi:MYXO-CTERM domain-containing protein